MIQISSSRAKKQEMGNMGRNTNYGFTFSMNECDKNKFASGGLEIGNAKSCSIGMYLV